jgi:hypothetical protein
LDIELNCNSGKKRYRQAHGLKTPLFLSGRSSLNLHIINPHMPFLRGFSGNGTLTGCEADGLSQKMPLEN